MGLSEEKQIYHDVYTMAQMISNLIRIFEAGQYALPYDDTTVMVLSAAQKTAIKDRCKALYAAIQTKIQSSIVPTL